MDQQKFAAYVDAFFAKQPPGENAPDARVALLMLYDDILKQAQAAAACVAESPEWYRQLVHIEQVLFWTPLKLFLPVLALDTELLIRASAKGELADYTWEFRDDPEVRFVRRANVVLRTFGELRLRQDALESEAVAAAVRRWKMATQGVTFTPLITIRDLSAEADE